MSNEYFYDYLSSLILQSPVLAINYILQCVAFALFLASFATFFLKTINFAYAEAVTNNRIAQIICIGCFLYLKAWNTWESWFIYFGYICSAYLGIYVYDCCLNISEAYTKKVRGYYVGQVFLYVWIGVFGLAGIYLLGF